MYTFPGLLKELEDKISSMKQEQENLLIMLNFANEEYDTTVVRKVFT